ncbi:MAG: hypothetical protein J6Y82_05100 [Bacteroidales bacterium]|nr:hypothetical protein [Bacteroidales bacterium]
MKEFFFDAENVKEAAISYYYKEYPQHSYSLIKYSQQAKIGVEIAIELDKVIFIKLLEKSATNELKEVIELLDEYEYNKTTEE